MTLKQNIISFLIITTLFGCGGGGGGGSDSLPLSISGTPLLAISEDTQYLFQVSTSNGSGNLTYSIANAPSWMTVSSSGVVSGIPTTDADAGTYDDIVVTVRDSSGATASLPSFTLEVTAINDSPLITFDSDTLFLEARQEFSITYSISDEEGDPFTIQVEGLENHLTLNVSDTIIEGVVPDINSVVTGNLSVIVESRGETSKAELNVTLHPMTVSGLGKTLIGSKDGKGIHLVILGDGYQASEFDLYFQDAFTFINQMNSDRGIALHMPSWNVHMIQTASVDSGSDLVFGQDVRNTYFNSGYNCFGIERLVCADDSIMHSTLLDEYPYYHNAVLVVNDSRYGGSGGQFAIFGRNAPEIALHEMGHSFANLADEYIDSNLADSAAARYTEGDFANISTSTDPNTVSWAHWIDDKSNFPVSEGEPGIGIFEGANYNSTGFFRPKSSSRMLSNNADFGSVNSEQWILEVYRNAGAVSRLLPDTSDVESDADIGAMFSVVPLFNSTVQSIEWYVDDVIQDSLTDQTSVTINRAPGSYAVRVRVVDITGFVRKSDPNIDFNNTWQLTIN